MKKALSFMLIISMLFYSVACTGQRDLLSQAPEQGESVKIHLKNGNIHEGLFVSQEDSLIKYVDSETHKSEQIKIASIKHMQISSNIYDFEAYPITDEEIQAKKGSSSTIGYIIGGVAIGLAAGFGIGIIFVESAPILLPSSMLAGGIGGGYYFGGMGSDADREESINKIRDKRFEQSKSELKEEMDITRKKLEEQQREKERLLKEIQEKKKQKENQ